jgi:hypothetical protein
MITRKNTTAGANITGNHSSDFWKNNGLLFNPPANATSG